MVVTLATLLERPPEPANNSKKMDSLPELSGPSTLGGIDRSRFEEDGQEEGEDERTDGWD